MERTPNCLAKLERVTKALRHEEPDRVPITDFFWGGFVRRWREELGLPEDANPYDYYDLDFIVTNPNLDPLIRPFETIREDEFEVVVKTGFGATLRKRFDYPMPEFAAFEIDSIEKLENFKFDDANDPRRYYSAGDNQIAGVGDGFERNSPPWVETVRTLRRKIPVFGSVIECSECLTRMIGQANFLLWIGIYPERLGACINRIGQFYLDALRAQIKAADGMLDGCVIWGDVAYKQTMLFSPDYWRQYFKPWVARMIEECHRHGLPVIYHGCGNVSLILQDFIEIGLDGYNPLEVKAGLDAVSLKKEFGDQLAFCGNNNIQSWESDDCDLVRQETLRKLNAAKRGGYIFMSDHSVSSGVSGKMYDFIVKLVREYGQYPLQLGEFDEDIS
jgi:hypothetical protein